MKVKPTVGERNIILAKETLQAIQKGIFLKAYVEIWSKAVTS